MHANLIKEGACSQVLMQYIGVYGVYLLELYTRSSHLCSDAQLSRWPRGFLQLCTIRARAKRMCVYTVYNLIYGSLISRDSHLDAAAAACARPNLLPPARRITVRGTSYFPTL